MKRPTSRRKSMPAASKTKRSSSRDPTTEFFDGLATRGHEPLLGNDSGTLRFDLVDGRRVEHWYVSIDRGTFTVSHDDVPADTVLRTARSVFDRIATGEVNAMAAILRGELVPEGDLALLMSFGRALPGPPRTRGRRRVGARGRSPR
jgi:putative sterol carrier protein